MRLVILSQYYPPETGAPQARLSDLAHRLSQRGHSITVFTAMPNYPAGRVHDPWRGRLVAAEEQDGVVVKRSWIRATSSGSRWVQLAMYGSFLASSSFTAPLRLRAADVVLWESPPLFLAPTAWALAKRTGARLVMNVSDLWPRSAVELGVLSSSALVAFFERWEAWSYRVADLVTCQTEGIADGVRARHPGAITFAYPNGVDTEFFRPGRRDSKVRARYGLPPGAAVVGYAGNFGRAQALEQVVEAAALLRDRSDIWFHLVGAGPCRDEVVERARASGLDRVVFSPPVPRAEVPGLLGAWDVSVVPLADAPVFAGARPSKMFELFAAGVPFVFCGRGEGAELARRSGGATIVEPEQPPGLALALTDLVDAGADARRARAEAARAFVVEEFDRRAIALLLEQRLLDLVDGARS